MLSKNDLNSIRVVVREEVASELVPVRNDIKNLQKDMAIVKKNVKNLRKDLDKTIDFFDKTNLSTRKGLNKTRKDLGLSEVNFAY